MNIGIFSASFFSIMFLIMAFIPTDVSIPLVIILFSIWAGIISFHGKKLIKSSQKDNKDIYPEEFTSIDDVPVVKIDEHC